MRHARKTPAKQFTGYKVHAAADAGVPILTAISLSPGNEHDGHHAGELIDQQREDTRPKRVIGDTAYGNVEVREELEQRRVEVHRSGAQQLAQGRGDSQGALRDRP